MIKRIILGLILLAVSASQALADKPLRIVALAPHIVENLYAIGAGDMIVGTLDYADYPQEATKIERIGGYNGISIEKLLMLNPDLVIAWKSGNKAEDLAQIKRLGIELQLSDPRSIEGVASEILKLGQLTGHIEQSKKVAEAFTARLNAIKATQQDKTILKGFYQLWPEPMMTVSKNTWINQLIETCQVTNVFANSDTDYPQISIENVIVTKPQIIIVPDEKSKRTIPTVNWQQWPEIPAVKYKQFININADLLHRFTPRMLDGLAQMCDKVETSREFIKSQL